LGINITRVSYNKAVDSHTLFIDAEGTEEQLKKANSELEKIGYLQNDENKSGIVLIEFRLKDVPGSVTDILTLINEFSFNISYISSQENGTEYQQKHVYFDFEREIPTNAQENAQIELTEAQRKQTEITTLLNLSTHIDNKTLLQLICEQLDIDYNDIKDKVPKEDDSADPFKVQSALDAVVVDEPDGGGVIE
jgi:ACT domain-containing protein